jgi:general secretion pathway protein D
MIALGGLIREELVEREERVPLLGDIPILGWLFKYQTTKKEKGNFMLFLNPKILKDAAMQTEVTGAKYNYIRAQQIEFRKRGVKLMADKESPLIPEFKEFLKLPDVYNDWDNPSIEDSGDKKPKEQNSSQDQSSNLSSPPALNEVSVNELNERDKLLYQQEIISQKNKQLILNGDVF